ncbi:MAG: L-glutamate gamma-semialdehyde dehydrogenase [Rickettsiales bacterium]
MSAAIAAISAHAFDAEAPCVEQLLGRLTHLGAFEPAILAQATAWATHIRGHRPGHGIEAFLQTYGLDTQEGVALMCLAEALLRIPDRATADALIHSTFDDKDWREGITGDEPWLIGASSWGLWLTGKVIADAPNSIIGSLRKLTSKMGEPVIRQALKQAMRMIGAQFVLAETVAEGIKNAVPWEKQGYRFSYDILGEGARSDAQAQEYLQAYREAIMLLGDHGASYLFAAPSVSVKLSALHPRYSMNQRERVLGELVLRVKEILLLAKRQNITVALDAEEANRFDISLMVLEALFADAELAGWNGIGFVLQAYQKRAIHAVEHLAALAERYQRIIPLRLVKGAYWDSEIKHAQIHGLPNYPVFTRKEHTDVSYLACADTLLKNTKYFYPQFATHNARTIASIQELVKHYGIAASAFEFQRLHGMGEALHAQVVGEHASRIYAPIGAHKQLLGYLIRRLLENGANTSFVNLLMDEAVPMATLLADPLAHAPVPITIPLPVDLYGDRKNSSGVDLGYLPMRESLEQMLISAPYLEVLPADISIFDLTSTIGNAQSAFSSWSQESVENRARIVEAIADAFERDRERLLTLLVQEAKKTLPDAIGEWREAIDYCRYYALQARRLMVTQVLQGPTGEANKLTLHARGVFGCISPWNFPLAIFTGQVVAALVTGNTVIAKPAEQTPRIAARAVALMHEAGVPFAVLQLAIGNGATIGQTITADARIAGIIFTGSVEVAQRINRTLAARSGPIVPLIAETGGQNCMVIDSSALLEQAVDDIIISAFGSAGQRCSALRVLYVQEDIADALLRLLQGAMRELVVGAPSDLATDIGPVIDAGAQRELNDYIATLSSPLAICTLSAAPGSFVTPQVFEISSIRQLDKEHFGPVLHVIRFAAHEHQAVVDAINATGFGLTFGIHSRIEETIRFFMSRVQAGNCYVNRSMIGAVVGVQPFGGDGLSGTGPKAGGPHYLLRFLKEHTATTNSAAIGGNIALMAGDRKTT